MGDTMDDKPFVDNESREIFDLMRENLKQLNAQPMTELDYLLEAGLRFSKGLLLLNSCLLTNPYGDEKTVIIMSVRTRSEIEQQIPEVEISITLGMIEIGSQMPIELYFVRNRLEWVADLTWQQKAWVGVTVAVATPVIETD